jgi:hypothetical protein
MSVKNNSHLHYRIVATLALLLSCSCFAQIPKLAEVPPTLPAIEISNLSEERSLLIKRRDQLQTDAKAHNTKCVDLIPGSTLAAECEREQKQLEATREDYIKAAQAFNRTVTNAVERNTACAGLAAQLEKDRTALRRLVEANKMAYQELEEWTKANSEAQAEALSLGVKALAGAAAETLQDQAKSAASYLGHLTRYEKLMKVKGVPFEILSDKIHRSARGYLTASIAAHSGTAIGAGLQAQESWDAVKKEMGAVANLQKNANAGIVEVINDPDLKKIVEADDAGREATKALVSMVVQSDELKKFAPGVSLVSFALDYGYEATKWIESRKRILQQNQLSEENLKAFESLRQQIERTVKSLKECQTRPSV